MSVPAPASAVPTVLAGIPGWLARVRPGWRTPSWRRDLAIIGTIGVIGDAITTSLIPLVSGIHEGNPVVVHLIGHIGSVPAAMVAIAVPLLLLMPLLAARPVDRTTRGMWSVLALVAVVKFTITISNLAMISSAVWHTTVIVA